MVHQTGYRLAVAEVVTETSDAISIVFDVDPSIAEHFGYRPGQFLTLRVPSDLTGSVARCYSLCGSPQADSTLAVTVKRTPDGYASNWLCDNVTQGTVIEVLPPAGSFGPSDHAGDHLLFAAGSGITPIMSIVKSLLCAGQGHVAVFYANRDAESVIFARQLADLESAHRQRLTIVHWLESERGRPGEQDLARFAAAYPARPAYACGPKAFMDVVQHGVRSTGSNPTVHIENFVSLARNPFEQGDDDAPPEVGPASATVTVDIDGGQHTFGWPDDMPLLDLLLANGIDAPFACQEGSCGSCECRITKGEVRMRASDALQPEDIAEGYILACQAVHTGTDVWVDYN